MELESRGLVQRAQGRGTFVTVRTPETSLFNFFRLRAADGTLHTPKLEHETARRRAATEAEREALWGRPDEVIEIERVRSLAGRAMTYEVSVISAALFPGLADRVPLPNTLYVFYQQAYSVIIVRADERLSAHAVSEASAKALGVPAGTPVLEVRRRAIDVLDRVVELRGSQSLTDQHDYFVSVS